MFLVFCFSYKILRPFFIVTGFWGDGHCSYLVLSTYFVRNERLFCYCSFSSNHKRKYWELYEYMLPCIWLQVALCWDEITTELFAANKNIYIAGFGVWKRMDIQNWTLHTLYPVDYYVQISMHTQLKSKHNYMESAVCYMGMNSNL